MSEFYNPHPEAYSRTSLEMAQYLLDTSDMPYSTDAYDERNALFQDVWNARGHLEETMLQAARQANIFIDEATMSEWQPDQTQLYGLYTSAERARKRYRMIEGGLYYAFDQQQIHNEYGVPLREYQQAPIRDFANFLLYAPRTNEYGGKSGIIEMPTGTGKTAIFANITSMLKHGEREHEPVRVLVLVPNQTILNQTMGRQGERGFGKFAPHLDIGAFYQHEKELDRDVVVMTTASFNNLMASGYMPHFDGIIVDEAHTVLGDVTANNLQVYGQDKIMVGLTATPEYDEQRSVYNLFTYKIHEMSFQNAVRNGLLAPVRGYLIDVEPEYDRYQLPEDPAERQRVKKQLHLQARVMEADKIIERALMRGVGVIVRCPAGDDIEIAVQYAAVLRNKIVPDIDGYGMRWITAEHVGGSYKRQDMFERHEVFDQFNNGHIDVLTYVRAIGMGWDSPHAKVYIDLGGTTSAVQKRQDIGRVERLIYGADGQPVEAEVYDFRDPTLGDKQYTCLDALEMAHGQLLSQDTEASEPIIPTPRKYFNVQTPEIYDVAATTIGEYSLEHAADALMPDNVEIHATINAYLGDSVPQDEACRILGVSIPTLKGILRDVGSNPNTAVPKDELEAIFELYPKLEAPDLPASGFISAREISRLANTPVRMLAIIPFARRINIIPYRFRKDGVVGFYFDMESAATLIEMINRGEHRRLTGYKYQPPQE